MARYNGVVTNRYPQTYSQKTYEQAVAATTHALDIISPDKNQAHFDEIVKFIGNVAKNEQTKEMASIKNYCEKMKKVFHKGMSDEWDFNKLLDEQYIKDHPLEFQAQFIIAFDSARHNAEQTLEQIKHIKTSLDESAKVSDLAKTDYLYRITGDLKAVIKSLIERRTKNQINTNTMVGKLEVQVQKILESAGVFNKLKGGMTYTKIGAGLTVELERRVQDIFRKSTEYKDLAEIPMEVFDEIGDKYIEELNTESPVTQFQRTLLRGFDNNSEMDLFLKNAGRILKIQEVPMTQEEINEIKQNTDQIKDKQTENIKKTCSQANKNIHIDENIVDSLYKVDFNISTESKGSHGDINEFVQSVVTGGGKVRTNVATDLVTYHIDCDITPDTSSIGTYIDKVTETLSSIGDELSSSKNKHDIDKLVARINSANNSLKNITKELEDVIKEIKGMENQKLFIQQETLKLHSSAGKNGQGFEGRSMVITSYISYLSSMNGVSGDLSINQNALEFLSYNLLPGGTISQNNDGKQKLENYFSFFSAMMMFDDLRNMAEEATQMISNQSYSPGNVQTLHIYNLNGMSVPASFVLNEMYNQLMSYSSMFKSSSQAARARIEYKNDPPQKISDIQVKITLLSGYETLMSQLFSQIS